MVWLTRLGQWYGGIELDIDFLNFQLLACMGPATIAPGPDGILRRSNSLFCGASPHRSPIRVFKADFLHISLIWSISGMSRCRWA